MTRILLAIVAVFTLALFSCSKESSIEEIIGDSGPPGPKHPLYVSPTGSGSGSAQKPFSTIQQAIDSASADSSITHILVAIGNYNESLKIGTPITIIGSLDPTDKWSRSKNKRTTLNGQQIEGTFHSHQHQRYYRYSLS